ncbi:MAG TPA: cysteine hydrolase family protein [Ilumatobacteraceae bacterium]
MTSASRPKTLRELSGLPASPPPLADAILIVIDAQREYLDGRLPLDGIEAALDNISRLLTESRASSGKIVHVLHKGRAGGSFDLDDGGRVIDQVAPVGGEAVVYKSLPNSFAATELRDVIAGFGDLPVVLTGFMTHMCVSATARAALDAGLAATVVGDACATRPLPSATTSSVLSADIIHEVALSELADRFAIVGSTAQLTRR